MSVPALTHSTTAALVVGAAIAFGGCNSLLDNRRAELVPDVSATDPADGRTPTGEAGRDGGAFAPVRDPPADGQGTVPPPCLVGEKPCGGICVSTNDASVGCGGPTCERCVPAHATAGCAGAACAIGTCDAGWADCNALAADGCETDLSSIASCGACGAACAAGENATSACVNLACVTTCAPGFGDCNLDPEDGCESDLLEERRNCGVCGRVCVIGRCDEGTCKFQL